jgi:1,5-anhydro-D-fructose reductase (1,5-anhydro-D-mannitol-forming)
MAYDSTANLVRIRDGGADSWQPMPLPQDEVDPFSRWIAHIRDGTRADDNLSRAVELTRLVSAANEAAAAATTMRYPMSPA